MKMTASASTLCPLNARSFSTHLIPGGIRSIVLSNMYTVCLICLSPTSVSLLFG